MIYGIPFLIAFFLLLRAWRNTQSYLKAEMVFAPSKAAYITAGGGGEPTPIPMMLTIGGKGADYVLSGLGKRKRFRKSMGILATIGITPEGHYIITKSEYGIIKVNNEILGENEEKELRNMDQISIEFPNHQTPWILSFHA